MTTKSIKYLYLIINKLNGCIEEINRNKCLPSVCFEKSKDKLKKYEELWSKIRDLTRTITKSLLDIDNYGEIYMKIKFNLDDDLPQTLQLYKMIIIVTSIFHDDNKYYT